jgi:hypothetical protein
MFLSLQNLGWIWCCMGSPLTPRRYLLSHVRSSHVGSGVIAQLSLVAPVPVSLLRILCFPVLMYFASVFHQGQRQDSPPELSGAFGSVSLWPWLSQDIP